MKKLLILALSLVSLIGYSQSTVNPDTVCYQTTGSTYTVPSLGAGYTYTWTVTSPGTITSGQTTNSIVVDWIGFPFAFGFWLGEWRIRKQSVQ